MEKYTSTLLPQDNTPQENQKAVLDLLKKTNQVHDDALSGINAAKAELQKQIDAKSGIVGYVFCRGNPATAPNLAINYTEELDTLNVYINGVFTFPSNGVALVNASYYSTSIGTAYIGKNTTLAYIALQSESIAGLFGGGGMMVPGITGDTIYINRTNATAASTTTALSIIFTEIK